MWTPFRIHCFLWRENDIVTKRSLWPNWFETTTLTAGNADADAHSRLEHAERSFVCCWANDDVQKSVFVYRLTALSSGAVSWLYCKSAPLSSKGARQCDRNACTHLSAAAAAGAAADGGVTPGANQLIDVHSSVAADYVTYDVTARGSEAARGENSPGLVCGSREFRSAISQLADTRTGARPERFLSKHSAD